MFSLFFILFVIVLRRGQQNSCFISAFSLLGSTVHWGPWSTNRLLVLFPLVCKQKWKIICQWRLTCSQHVQSPSRYWLSRSGLAPQISRYPHSWRRRGGTGACEAVTLPMCYDGGLIKLTRPAIKLKKVGEIKTNDKCLDPSGGWFLFQLHLKGKLYRCANNIRESLTKILDVLK